MTQRKHYVRASRKDGATSGRQPLLRELTVDRSIAVRPPNQENTTMKTIYASKGRVIRAFGQEAHVLVSSEQTGDAFCVLRFFIPPANVTPPHLHRATNETFLIESGEIEINRGLVTKEIHKPESWHSGFPSGRTSCSMAGVSFPGLI